MIKLIRSGEVVKGPYENAVHEIQREHLEGKIFPRFADGLKAIEDDDQIDTITICGMGGTLIRNILEEEYFGRRWSHLRDYCC